MMKKLYIAYGSNLNMEQMSYRCPDARPLGIAYLKGYEMLFRGNSRGTGVATIEKCAGSVVPVGIWSISEQDEEYLDIYEGFPTLYRKEYLPLSLNGERMTGLIYVMNEGRRIAEPSEFYVDTIRFGYLDFGIDMKYLDKALDKMYETL